MAKPSYNPAADLKKAAGVETAQQAQYFVKRSTFKRLNARRFELVRTKHHARDLTEAEQRELEALHAAVRRLVDLAYPRVEGRGHMTFKRMMQFVREGFESRPDDRDRPLSEAALAELKEIRSRGQKQKEARQGVPQGREGGDPGPAAAGGEPQGGPDTPDAAGEPTG